MESLIKDLPVKIYGKKVKITDLSAHSKTVSPGTLFIDKSRGAHIPEAIQGGAVAIATDRFYPLYREITQIVTENILDFEREVAFRFYEKPDLELFLTAITGTNGKTTTTYLIKHLMDQKNEKCGLLGTVEWIIGDHILPSTHTTPDLITTLKLLRQMRRQKCKAGVMEVSSHALDQGRVRDIHFDAAIFTNLSQDHLDYHKTMEAYAAAKVKLFSSLAPEAYAIINIDDPWAPLMLQDCKSHVIKYGFQENADLKASAMKLSPQGMEFLLEYQGQKVMIQSPLIGRFNAYNLMAATGVGLIRWSLQEIAAIWPTFHSVPGRLQRVINPKNLNIFVDYAHTDDALTNVLQTLNEIKQGKIITVFGCGGNRDTAKRPKMATAAEALSDFVIVTTDNPRHEDPCDIIRHIIAGFQNKSHYMIEMDRARAIQRALQLATPDDIVLIAGKGHEKVQIFKDATLPFDDAEVVRTLTI